MKVEKSIPKSIHTHEGGEQPPCIGFTSNAIPEAQSRTETESLQRGVSTQSTQSSIISKAKFSKHNTPQWYVLRTTYGREKKAFDYLKNKGITVFHPTQKTVRLINGKRKTLTISLLPNLFFAHSTEEQLKPFVFDNVNLPFLRFYYHYTHIGNRIERTPMIIPDNQMNSLKIICLSKVDNAIISLVEVPNFHKGQLVKVVDGAFKGVIGRVARWQGQQRVGVIIDGLMTAVTAYVPTAFCEEIK